MPIDYLLETDARTIVAKKKCIQELENLNACYKLIQKVNERLKY